MNESDAKLDIACLHVWETVEALLSRAPNSSEWVIENAVESADFYMSRDLSKNDLAILCREAEKAYLFYSREK